MASPSELKFIVKAQNDAQAPLKDLQTSLDAASGSFTKFNTAATSANKASNEVNKGFKDISGIVSTAANNIKNGTYTVNNGFDLITKKLPTASEALAKLKTTLEEGARTMVNHGKAAHKTAEDTDKATEAAKRHGEEVHGLSGKLGEVAEKAVKVGETLVAMWASNEVIKGAVETFERVEVSMQRMAYYSGLGHESVEKYREEIDKLGRDAASASRADFEKLFETAIRLGGSATENISKFAHEADLLGKEGSAGAVAMGNALARLVQQSGEGLDAATKYGDAAALLSKNSKQSIAEILTSGATLGGFAREIHMATTDMLAFANTAQQVGVMPMRMGSAMVTAVNRIREVVEAGGNQLKVLEEQTGKTREQLIAMSKDPRETLLTLLDVFSKLKGDEANAKALSEALGLEGLDRTLLSVSDHVSLLRKNLHTLDTGNLGSGQASKAAQSANRTELDDQLTNLGQAWDRFKGNIGEGMTPAVAAAVNLLSVAVDNLGEAIKSIGPDTKEWLGTLIDFSLVAVSVSAAIGTVKGLVTLFAGATGTATAATTAGATALGLLRSMLLAVVSPIGTVIGFLIRIGAVVVSALGSIVSVPGAIVAAIAVAVAAIAGLVASIIRHWGDIAKGWQEAGFRGAISAALKGVKDDFVGFFSWLIDYAASAGAAVWDFLKHPFKSWRKEEKHDAHGDEHGGGHGEHAAEGEAHSAEDQAKADKQAAEAKQYLLKIIQEHLSAYEKQRNAIKEVMAAEDALAALEKKNDLLAPSERRTKDELIGEAQGIATARRKADPVREYVYQQGLAIEQAKALTKYDKDAVELQLELNKLYEDGVALTTEEGRKKQQLVISITQARQAQQVDTEFRKQVIELNDQLRIARAITEVEKDRVTLQTQLEKLIRDNGYSPQQAQYVIDLMNAERELARVRAQSDALNPLGKAQRDYASQQQDLAIRRNNVKSSSMSDPDKQAALAALDAEENVLKTQYAQRLAPVKYEIQLIKEKLELEKVSGDYAEADRQTLQKVIELRRMGYEVSKEDLEQMVQMNREMQDMQKAQRSGLTGWVNSVGTLKDNLQDATKNFADGLDKAIEGALDGKKDAWRNFILDTARQIRHIGMQQTMKLLFTNGTDNANEGLAGWLQKSFSLFGQKHAEAMGNGVAAAAEKINTVASMEVQAATVIVNGANVTGAMGIPGVPGSPGVAPTLDKPYAGLPLPAPPSGQSSPFGGIGGSGSSFGVSGAPTTQLPLSIGEGAKFAFGSGFAPNADSLSSHGIPSVDQINATRILKSHATDGALRSGEIEALHPVQAQKMAEMIQWSKSELGAKVGILSAARKASQTGSKFDTEGNSLHPAGLAGDFNLGSLSDAQYSKFAEHARSIGLYRPWNSYDERNHWQIVPNKIAPRDARFDAVTLPTAERLRRQNELYPFSQRTSEADMPTADASAVGGNFLPPGVSMSDLMKSGFSKLRGSATSGFDQLAPQLKSQLMGAYGLTDNQASGIVGNLAQETGGFTKFQNGVGATGWAQWLGTRKNNFFSHANDNGLDPTSAQANWSFLQKELGTPQYQKMLASIRGRDDLGFSTKTFMDKFERPNDNSFGDRLAWAKQAQGIDGRQFGDLEREVQKVTQSMPRLTEGFTKTALSSTGLDTSFVATTSGISNSGNEVVSTFTKIASSSFGGGGGGGLLSGLFGGGGGFGGDAGGASAGVFHSGGLIDGSSSSSRFLSRSTFSNAPRFHKGLHSDEFPAVLQRGERVLTARQNDRVTAALSAAGAAPSAGGKVSIVNNFSGIHDMGGFQRSEGQINLKMATATQRATARYA